MTYQIIIYLFSILTFTSDPQDTRHKEAVSLKENPQLENILILFMRKKIENRKLVEDELTYYINDKGFGASPSHRYFYSYSNTEEIIQLAKENNFDGILVIQVIALNVKEKWVNAKMKYGRTNSSPFFYGYFDLSRQYSVGYSTNEISFELETTLFRISDLEMIESYTSKKYNNQSLDTAIESFAKWSARRLKKSKLLRKIEE